MGRAEAPQGYSNRRLRRGFIGTFQIDKYPVRNRRTCVDSAGGVDPRGSSPREFNKKLYPTDLTRVRVD